MKMIRFHLKSLSPGMLQNPATQDLLEALRTKKPMQKKTDWTPYDEAVTKLYRSEPAPSESPEGPKKPGLMGVPTQNIMSCLVLAGRLVKSGKASLSTAKDTKVFGFLEFMDDFCPFKGCDEKGEIPWMPFKVKGTMHQGASETAVCINRPRIPSWELSFTVKFDNNQNVDESTVRKLIEAAGRQIGLGDWRPAKRGRFGRFVLTKMEVLDVKVEEQKTEVLRYEGALADNAPDDLKALAAVA